MKKFKNTFWFTVAEILIAMIIISTISTIAFFNYKEYTQKSRDAVRVTSLSKVEDILEIYKWENWAFPFPEWTIATETDSSGVVWSVWKFWNSVVEKIKASYELPVDPKTKEKYIYKLNSDWDIYKIIANTELSGEIIVTNQKEKFTWLAWVPWFVVVEGPYVNSISNHTFRYVSKTWPDPNCDLPDLQILDWSWTLLQTWAWCNSTLGNGVEWWGVDWSEILSATVGGCYNYNWSFGSSSYCISTNPMMNSSSSALNYFNSILAWPLNIYSDAEYDAVWWKLYTYKMANSYSSIACPSGWRVPTAWDLSKILTSLWCSTHSFNNADQCPWLWWRWHTSLTEPQYNLTKILKLPLSWYYSDWHGQYRFRGRFSSLVSSNRDWYYDIYSISFDYNKNTLRIWKWPKNNWYSLRCIKSLD